MVGDKSLIPSPSTSITYKTYPEDFVVIEDRSLYAFLGVDEEKDNSSKHNTCADAKSSLQLEAKLVLKSILKVNEMEQLENLQLDGSIMTLPVHSWSKEERSLFHKSIRTAFKGQLDSKTKSNNEEIVVSHSSLASGRWDTSRGDYIHFTAIKMSMTTTELIEKLCKATGLSPKRFEFCGSKDKKAVTAQRISVWRMDPEFVKKYRSKMNNDDLSSLSSSTIIHLCDFDMNPKSDTPMKLSDISGNFFALKLRCSDENTLDQAMETIKLYGDDSFVNIFGNQRFGHPLQINPEVGKCLLKGEYRNAIMLMLLSPTKEEVDYFNITSYKLVNIIIESDHGTSNTECFQLLHKWYSLQTFGYESSNTVKNNRFVIGSIELILYLLENPSNFCKNFSQVKIPRGTSPLKKRLLIEMARHFKGVNEDFDKINFDKLFHKLQKANQQLFVNSYQSRLWNDAALERYELSPTKAQSNDLILVDKQGQPLTAWHVAERNIIMNGNFISPYPNTPITQDLSQVDKYFYKQLTEDDDFTKYPIESVIIPMPGYETNKTCLPRNMNTQIEQDDMEILLSKEQKNAIFRIPGAFRHLLSKPTNVRYRRCSVGGKIEDSFRVCNNNGISIAYENNKLSVQVENFMQEGDENLNKIISRVSPCNDIDKENIGYIQICFALCSSTYATTYIENLLHRLDLEYAL